MSSLLPGWQERTQNEGDFIFVRALFVFFVTPVARTITIL